MAILLQPPKNQSSPRITPLVTLREGVVFPHSEVILSFGRKGSIKSVTQAEKNDRLIVIVSQKSPSITKPTLKDIYTVGTLCRIQRTIPVNNELHAIVKGISRVKIHDITIIDNILSAAISKLPETQQEDDYLKATVNHLISQVKTAVNLGKPNIETPMLMRLLNSTETSSVADQVASILELSTPEKQALLEQTDLKKRLEQINQHLDKEINILKLEQKIASKTQSKFDQSMKEAVLRERMRMIQQELGEDDEGDELTSLKKKINQAGMPKAAKQKALKDLKRLQKLSLHSPESGYIRSWLETMVEIPWSKSSANNISLTKAAKILKQDHYALEEVKERILEYLAVMQLKKKRSNKKIFKNENANSAIVPTIICFVGPPGVGKTSVGRSIAKALGRNFAKLSLGGIKDEAEIRGHRRTYVGAMPGRVVQSLIDAGTNNPVIMLDEIDKIGTDYRGDPSAALLEVLDPEQNHAFVDHYLDTSLDLSKVMFITTANVLETIPPALRDRLEIIQFSGYTQEEKYFIARNHLIPKQLSTNALTPKDIALSPAAVRNISKFYTHEAGVRNLEREISKVFRKVARKIASSRSIKTPIKITPKNLSTYLGPRKFTHTIADEQNRVGIATGLAYTQTGGDILFIEVALMEGKGRIQLTGQLGDVMKESAQAALSYVRSHAKQLKIDPKRFAKTDVHIHVPEGATPKDGPSAGVAITTALISAFTNKPINRLVGMTGEISLRGRVMEIGGVKEKTIAGHRSGLKHIILPKDNRKDLVKVPPKVKKDLKFSFVTDLEDVLKIALLNS
jgi:ATP-dependent Lon protease